jgi:WD40 repeat protein
MTAPLRSSPDLSPLIDFSSEVARLTMNFTGREWLFEEINAWLTDDNAPCFFIITGEPGIGKSAIAARLVQGEVRVSSKIDAYHFCIRRWAETIDPEKFVRSFARQLGAIEGFAEALAEKSGVIINASQSIHENHGQAVNVCIDKLVINRIDIQSLFMTCVLEPLARVLKDHSRPVVLLIDSLDEAQAKEGATILGLFANNKFPAQVRIIFTTRKDPFVLRHLPNEKYRLIDAGEEGNLDDMRRYISDFMTKTEYAAQFVRQFAEAGMSRQELADQMISASKGNFLYVVHLLPAIARGTQKIGREMKLPNGLDGIYKDFFRTRRVGKNEDEWEKRFRPIAGVLCVAREKVREELLAGLSGLGTRQMRDALRAMTQFLNPVEFDENQYAFYHHSIIDFFLDKNRAEEYWIDIIDIGRQVCDYFQGFSGKWNSCSDYGIRHMPYHLAASGRQDELAKLLLDYQWLDEKLRRTGIQALLNDFGYVKEDKTCALVASALRMSSHILARDPGELAGQLTGRLCGHYEKDGEIARLLAQIREKKKDSWLRTMHPSMQQAGGTLIRTFEGHSNSVKSVAVLSNGKEAISGSEDNTLKLWNIESGECARTFEGHSNSVDSVAVLPNGKEAISGSADSTLKLWNIESGECVRTFEGHSDWVTSVAVLPNRKEAISGSYDKTLKLWNIESGECVRTFEGHSSSVTSVAVLPNSKEAISGSRDKTLKLWNIESGECVRTFEEHSRRVTSVAVLPNGKEAISGSRDKTLKLWSIESGECVRTFEGHSSFVTLVAVLPNGKEVISGSYDKTLKLWSIESGECVRTFEGHSSFVTLVAVLPNGKEVISGSYDKTLKLWNIESGECVRTFEGHSISVFSVAVHPNGNEAISGSRDKTLKLWNIESGECIRTVKGHSEWVTSVAVLRNGKEVISGSDDNTLKLWNIKRGECARTFEGHLSFVTSVAVLPNGKEAISGSRDKTLKLWNLESGECVKTFEGHSNTVTSVVVLPNGKEAVSGSYDNTLKLWNLESGECVRTFEGHSKWITSVAVLPSGKEAISGACDKTLKLWNLESGDCIRTFDGHSDYVNSVAVNPDGMRAISGSRDKTLKLSDLESAECIHTLSLDAEVSSCTTSADGSTIVAGDNTGKLHFLAIENLPSGPPIITPCKNQKHNTLAFHCPFCRQWTSINESQIGKQITCPGSCNKKIVLNPFYAEAEWERFANANALKSLVKERK